MQKPQCHTAQMLTQQGWETNHIPNGAAAYEWACLLRVYRFLPCWCTCCESEDHCRTMIRITCPSQPLLLRWSLHINKVNRSTCNLTFYQPISAWPECRYGIFYVIVTQLQLTLFKLSFISTALLYVDFQSHLRQFDWLVHTAVMRSWNEWKW